MFACPNCQTLLRRARAEPGVFWTCGFCGGRAVSFSFLRRRISSDVVNQLWSSAIEGKGERKRPCPLCHGRMVMVRIALHAKTLVLDVCRPCQFVWFDPGEYAEMPTPAAEQQVSPAAREVLDRREAQGLAETPQETEESEPLVDKKWKWVPALLGMPVELRSPLLLHRPWLTWSLAAAVGLVSLVAFFNLETAILQFGLIPAQAWRLGGLTFLTSFFLHVGLFHLIGNMYFLIIFGDNVEDYLGRSRYLLLLLVGTLAGDALHILSDPRSVMPSIGASGGISGLIAFYALQFPRARLLVWIRWLWLPIPCSGSAGSMGSLAALWSLTANGWPQPDIVSRALGRCCNGSVGLGDVEKRLELIS